MPNKYFYELNNLFLFRFMHQYNLQKSIAVAIIFFLFFIGLSVTGICQEKNTAAISRNTLYADFASKDVYYSINLDHIFFRGNKLSYSYRAGVSILKDAYSFPVGIQCFTGANSSHAEFSLTLIPYVDHSAKSMNRLDNTDKFLYVEPGVGYRYQAPGGGLFFKAIFTPIILLDPPSNDFWNMDPKLFAGGNIGIGYTFPTRQPLVNAGR